MSGSGVAAPVTARVTITRMKTGRTDGGAGPTVPETALAVPAQITHATTATIGGMTGENRVRGSEATILPDILHRSRHGSAPVFCNSAGEVNVLV
jgi:hypothetical protein